MIDERISNLCVNVTNETFQYPTGHRFVAQYQEGQKGHYDTNHGKIAFITENRSYYVSPFVNELIPLLEEKGFTPGSVVEPFSNGGQPSPAAAMRMYNLMSVQSKMDNQNQEYETVSRHL